MKKIVGAFFAACLGLAALSHGHAQVTLPWPGGAGSGAVADCTYSGASGSFTVSTIGAYRYYIFSGTTSGTSTVTCPSTRNIDLLVIGSGGGGNTARQAGGAGGAGGGAGEYCTQNSYSVTAGDAIQITVPAGGLGATADGGLSVVGAATVWNVTALHGSTISAHGGGNAGPSGLSPGGSGGGGENNGPPGTTSQTCGGAVNPAGTTPTNQGAGGGGAGSPSPNGAGVNAPTTGGSGLTWYDGVARAGGGGGSSSTVGAAGGLGGGGNGSSATAGPPNNGVANTGSGGGGATPTTPGACPSCGGQGGSGTIAFRHLLGPPVTAACTTTGTATLDQAGSAPSVYSIYKFTGNGTINCPSNIQVQYLLVGGGGGSAGSLNCAGGGGGAGGVRSGIVQLNANQTYQITIGAGGTGVNSTTVPGNPGQPSLFDSIATAFGGGGGSGVATSGLQGRGASSGGNTYSASTVIPGIAGQGNSGGIGGTACWGGGGGGGATGVGTPGNASSAAAGVSGNGGPGYVANLSIFGAVGVGGCVAGGGAGGRSQATGGSFVGTATCGGGIAGQSGAITGGNGAANTGGGGGGGGTTTSSDSPTGGNGGSGILVVAHPLTQPTTICTANTDGGGSDANTLALFHFDGAGVPAPNGPGAYDSAGSGQSLTLTGTSGFSGAQSKFGGGSYLGAASSYAKLGGVPFNGITDTTIEAWMYWTSTAAATVMSAYAQAPSWYYNVSGTTNQDMDGPSNSPSVNAGGAPALNAWHHYAWVRQSGTWKLYLDGVSQTTSGTQWSNALGNGVASWYIGNNTGGTYYWNNGYIDEMRISNFARYTANFTPPTLAFCDPVASPISAPTLFANSGTLGVNSATQTTTTTAPIVAGNLAVLQINVITGNAVTINSVSDGTNTYTRAIRQASATTYYTELWYKENAAAVSSGATITVTFSAATGTNSNVNIAGAQAKGVLTASSLDKTAGVNGAATQTVAVPALTTSPQIAFCSGFWGNLAASNLSIPDPAYTNFYSSFGTGLGGFGSGNTFDWRTVTNPTAINYAPTWSVAGAQNQAACATFIHG